MANLTGGSAQYPLKIGIAIGKGHTGLQALQSVLQEEVLPGGLIYLLHVQRPIKTESAQESKDLINQYVDVCLKHNVKVEVCYSVGESVTRMLVDQILKLGLTKLVVGASTSKQSTRAFKESTAASVARHAPVFCTVMIVHNGRLCSVRNGKLYLDSSSSSVSDDPANEYIAGRRDSGSMDYNNSSMNNTQNNSSHTSFPSSHQFVARLRTRDHFINSQNRSFMPYVRSSEGSSSNSTNPAATSLYNPDLTSDQVSSSSMIGSVRHDLHDRNQGSTESAFHPLYGAMSHLNLLADLSEGVAEKQTGSSNDSTEAIVANAQRMSEAYEQKCQELEISKQKSLFYERRYRDALAKLDEALTDNAKLRETVSEESQKHKEALSALNALRYSTGNHSLTEMDLTRQETTEAHRRLVEVTAQLEELERMLVEEKHLRIKAEEKASKQEALSAVGKVQYKYSEYTYDELRLATDNFNQLNKLGEGGYGPVYKGRMHHTDVAVKLLAREGLQGWHEFQREVEVLSHIRHPHMVIMLGLCPEKASIVYEFMPNGSLEDRLNCKGGTPPLPWYVRFRICFEVATALLFLHSRSQPIVHRDLKPGNILLDRNYVSKIGDVGIAKLVPSNLTFSGETIYKETVLGGTFAYMDPDYQRTGVISCESDVYALGIVMLQILTGKPPLGVSNAIEKAIEDGNLGEVLDKSAGEWPLSEAMELASLGLQCTEPKRRHRVKLETYVLPVLENIRRCADEAATSAHTLKTTHNRQFIIPSSFFCPISQEIMDNPYIAADGFTYEHDVIKAWLENHSTSPMTNLMLSHKNIIPNHSIRSAIREWQERGVIPK